MNKKLITAVLGTLAMGTMNLAIADEKPADAPKAEKGKKGKKGDAKGKGGEKSCSGEKGCKGAK